MSCRARAQPPWRGPVGASRAANGVHDPNGQRLLQRGADGDGECELHEEPGRFTLDMADSPGGDAGREEGRRHSGGGSPAAAQRARRRTQPHRPPNEQGHVRVSCQGAVSPVDHPSAGEAGPVLVVAPADPVARRLQRMHSRGCDPAPAFYHHHVKWVGHAGIVSAASGRGLGPSVGVGGDECHTAANKEVRGLARSTISARGRSRADGYNSREVQ
jgi:hypothetical protein